MKLPLVIHLEVPGLPKPQPRPRLAWRGRRPHAYTPATARAWKQQITLVAKQHRPPPELRTVAALSMWVHFRFDRPRSHYHADRRLKEHAPPCHTRRPDLDNLLKAVMDALTAAGLWRDDAQLVRVEAVKSWADEQQKQGCTITLHYHSISPAS